MVRRRHAALLAAILAAGCSGSTAGERGSGSGTRPPACRHEATTARYRRVAGVAPNLTSLDVHPPDSGCRRPVVVWVHGGGYRVGDKRNAVADKVRWANEHGWVLVSVNYRLTRPGSPTGARFPDHYDDVAAAVAWVRDHVHEHGGDPARIALLGHSAGADIVSNVLVVPDYLAAHGERPGSVRCGGPLDTEGFDKPRAVAGGGRDRWAAALGNEPGDRVRTSATLQVRAGTGIPPMIGVVRGAPRRRSIEQGFLDALRAAGVPARGIDARSLTHSEVNRRIGAPGDTVMTPPLTEFLEGCFRSGGHRDRTSATGPGRSAAAVSRRTAPAGAAPGT